jgi:hypothetical protein
MKFMVYDFPAGIPSGAKPLALFVFQQTFLEAWLRFFHFRVAFGVTSSPSEKHFLPQSLCVG